jgi:energy-coupling factor transport system substrate-specific component
MSWQLVSFLILAVVLLGGFAWYERSRPPAQVVALVAALAALAIAGRIAFAAFPNVKPTTDIVIFAGYALGPAAGFAVGALAALVSNFWFGQGPWTPWQMAAWGLCGILGAALALATRKVGRLTLAVVCGLAAVGYGAILNFSLMATYGGELSWERFWVLSGRAIPFEIAHATGNVVFALVAGPAMIRMLIRFRERFEWRRADAAAIVGTGGGPMGGGTVEPPSPGRRPLPTGSVAALLVAVLLLGAFASTRAQAATVGPGPEAAANWLKSVQNEDGGWGEKVGAGSSQDMTGWAMLGLEAAGVNPQDVASGKGEDPVEYLQSQLSQIQSPGDLARTILALEGAGVEPREFGGRNLVQALLAKRRKDGSYEDWPNSTAYAVLALRSAGIGNVADSLEWLREAQNEDGGWGDYVGTPSNADGTGAVLQALSPSSKAAQKAVGYLRQAQQKGGGYRLGGNGALNTQSTAWAVEGLLAAGANPAEFKRGGRSAYEYLEGNQVGDGHYRYSGKSDQTPVWVTGQVMVATSQKHLPLEAVPRAPRPKKAPKVTPTSTQETEPLPLPDYEAGGVTPVPNAEPVFPAKRVHSGSEGKKNGGKSGSRRVPGGVNPGGPKLPPSSGGRGGGGAAEETYGEGVGAIEGSSGGSSGGAPPSDEEAESGSGTPVLGSIIAGLAAGGLIFALFYGPFRRWQKNRAAKAKGDGPPPAGPPQPPGPSAPSSPAGPAAPPGAQPRAAPPQPSGSAVSPPAINPSAPRPPG